MIQILNNGIYYYDDSYYFDSLNDENNVYFIADTFSIVLKYSPNACNTYCG